MSGARGLRARRLHTPPPPTHPPFQHAQGVGAYSFAPVFEPEGDACFDTPAAASVACSFRSASAFVLRVCAASGVMPEHTCGGGG
jgi:hypothetical protein